ncbi:hypothetical protein SAMN04487948_101150 [Halogranum amylolyticum]|uniref:Uncharacterized protein n=1 Tax=Halogranum amylolyticum TaxID=660520 RepID=A0A1H8MX20_9EURY|nr:hypothetical protein [Halogranum amylolyticum]SEO21820.1 hypothetical protein SAMN04487948_101150 [Halogranum amylolyticum]
MTPERRRGYRPTRRRLLAAFGATTTLSGCLSAPSSGGPQYETHEIDGGAVFAPGLQDENEDAVFAALVTTSEESEAFVLDQFPAKADRTFVRATDFATQYLGVVQVAGLNSSMGLRVVDVAASRANLTVVVAVDDPTPQSDDRVVTTLLVRVTRDGDPVPDAIRVELSFDGRHETFSGE